MPKTRRSGRRRNDYYGYNGYGWNDQNLQNQENYPSGQDRYYYDYYGGDFRNRRQGPYNVNRSHQNYRSWQKSWNGHPGNKQKNSGHNQQTTVQNKNKSLQNASGRLLAALDKTAKTLSTNNGNVTKYTESTDTAKKSTQSTDKEEKFTGSTDIKKCVQSNGTKETTVKEGKSFTAILDGDFEKQVTTKQSTISFQLIWEEKELAYKALKISQKLEQQRQLDSNIAVTKKICDDEETLKGVKLFQTRVELVEKTKQTGLYKAYKEHTKKDVPSKDIPKTPETAMATSRWKEDFFKQWKFDLVRFGYRFLDGIDWEKDEEGVDE